MIFLKFVEAVGSQGGEHVGKGSPRFASVVPHWLGRFSANALMPKCDQTVQQKARRCGSPDSLASSVLRLVDAEVLFAFVKSDFDRPAAREPLKDLLGLGVGPCTIKHFAATPATKVLHRHDLHRSIRSTIKASFRFVQPHTIRATLIKGKQQSPQPFGVQHFVRGR